MGWSCTAKANETLDHITSACLRSTGIQNSWKANHDTYFWELTSKEYEDGHIHCSVLTIDGARYGSIYINPDGTIRRIPITLRRLLGE